MRFTIAAIVSALALTVCVDAKSNKNLDCNTLKHNPTYKMTRGIWSDRTMTFEECKQQQRALARFEAALNRHHPHAHKVSTSLEAAAAATKTPTAEEN